MANKKIKKIDISGTQYDLRDATAIQTINGYELPKIQPISGEPEITFANKAITTAEIDSLLNAQGGSK